MITTKQKGDPLSRCNNEPSVYTKKRAPVLSSNQCNTCYKTFDTIQECLRHDLLEHSTQCRKRKKTSLNKRCQLGWKFLNSPEKLEERARVHKALQNCTPGMELQEIFKILCMNHENLQLLFARIQTRLAIELRALGQVTIHQFGSIASKLALKDCDIDVYIDVSKMFMKYMRGTNTQGSELFHPKSKWHKIAFNRIEKILKESEHFSNVIAIRGARVPIIKCKHLETGFNIDINLSCANSVENTRFLESLVNSDERIHALMLFLKIWAKHMQIVNQEKMSSYCLIVLVIFFLQQPLDKLKDQKYPSFLLPIKDLQENCIKDNYIQGINYAYNLTHNINRTKPNDAITVVDLIMEFFYFYKNFNFADYIIAPHLGVAILKSDFITGQFSYPMYHKQLHIISLCWQKDAQPFQIDCCLCVQDPFNLTHNVGKSLQPNNVEYFQYCLANASYICDLYNIDCNGGTRCGNRDIISLNDFYEALLYDVCSIAEAQNVPNRLMKFQVKGNTQLPENNRNNGSDNGDNGGGDGDGDGNGNGGNGGDNGNDGGGNCSNNCTSNSFQDLGNQKEDHSLRIVHIPTRNDLRALGLNGVHVNGTGNNQNTLKQWCRYYMRTIEIILSQIYRFDMELQANFKKIKRNIDNDKVDDTNTTKVWYISNSIDLWTNRCHQKSSEKSFMQYQLEQTERLYKERSENCKSHRQFLLDFKALLTVNVANDFTNLEILLTLPDGSLPKNLCRKHPFRRFFNIFKCTLDNFNLKEALRTSLFEHF